MKVYAYAIAKNEEANVPRFLEQTKMFDGVVVLDTGSTDKTVELLRAGGAIVHEQVFPEFDFSEARNAAIACVPEDVEWLVSYDFNEVFTVTSQQMIEIRVSRLVAMTVNCRSAEVPEYHELKLKCHRRNAAKWHYAVHEELRPIVEGAPTGESTLGVTKHCSNVDTKHSFYTQIALREHEKHPKEKHYIWWLLKYYQDIKDDDKTLDYCYKYLGASEPYSINFRVFAYIHASRILYNINKDKAIDLSIHALSEAIVFRGINNATFYAAMDNLKQNQIELTIK